MDSKALARVAGRYGLRAVILFGSRARGSARPGSDFDLCLVAPRLRGDEGRLIGELADVFRGDVDVCFFERIGPSLAYTVATEGRLLHGSKDEFDRIQVHAIQRWQDSYAYVTAVRALLDRILA